MLDSKILLQLVQMRMPFGKHKGVLICNLPMKYLEWFKRKGFPKGNLGMLMETMFEIRLNGLERLLEPLKNNNQK